MRKVYIIDRFEGEYAVCEDEGLNFVDIKKDMLPSDAKEGDVIIQNGDLFTIDLDEVSRRRERIQRKMAKLWK